MDSVCRWVGDMCTCKGAELSVGDVVVFYNELSSEK